MQPDKQNNYWQNSQSNPGLQPNANAAQPVNYQTNPDPVYQQPSQNVSQANFQNPQQPTQINVEPVLPPTQPQEMYTPTPVAEAPVNNPSTNNVEVTTENSPIHWSANEYIYREKNQLWFIIFAIVIVVFIVGDILFLKSYTFSALVIVMAISVVIYSRRPPRVIDYALSNDHGLYVGEKLYHFSEFKAFGVIQEDGYNSIMLIPIKRFSPGVSVYFPQEVGEKIVDVFGSRLPMEAIKLDFMDIIVRKLRL